MGRAYGEMVSPTVLPVVMWLLLHSLGTGDFQVVSEFLIKHTVLCVVKSLCPMGGRGGWGHGWGEEESRAS